jgi:hypothetical protein
MKQKNLIGDNYSNTGWMIKSRSLKWARHVARMGQGRGEQRILVGKTEGKRPTKDLDVDGRIILK